MPLRITQKYSDHNNELQTMVAYLTGDSGGPSEDATRLGVTAEQVTELTALSAAHDTAYATYTDPNTHNTITVGEMKVADDNACTDTFDCQCELI